MEIKLVNGEKIKVSNLSEELRMTENTVSRDLSFTVSSKSATIDTLPASLAAENIKVIEAYKDDSTELAASFSGYTKVTSILSSYDASANNLLIVRLTK